MEPFCGEIQELIAEAESFTNSHSIGDDNNQSEVSGGACLLIGAESILSRSMVNKLAAIAPQNVGRKIEQLRQEILLAGPEYDDAIRQCAAIALEDYKFAEVALKETKLLDSLDHAPLGRQPPLNHLPRCHRQQQGAFLSAPISSAFSATHFVTV